MRLYWKNPTQFTIHAPEAGLCWIDPVFWPAEAESARLSGRFIVENPTYVPERGKRSSYPAQNPM